MYLFCFTFPLDLNLSLDLKHCNSDECSMKAEDSQEEPIFKHEQGFPQTQVT